MMSLDPTGKLPMTLRSLLPLFAFLLILAACEAEDDQWRGGPGGDKDQIVFDTDAPDAPFEATEDALPEDAAPTELVEAVEVIPETATDTPTETTQTSSIQFVTDENYVVDALDLVKGAASTVDVAQFEANDDGVVKAVLGKLVTVTMAGVGVRVLLDDEVEDNQLAISFLEDAGVQAKVDAPQRRLHVKLFTADGNDVLLGSSNLSAISMKYSHEVNLRIRDQVLGAAIDKYFSALWADSTVNINWPNVHSNLGTLAFDKKLYDLLRERIQGATTRIHGVYYVVSDATSAVRKILDDLGDAKARGVDVVFILEHSNWADFINDFNYDSAATMRADGITVLRDGEDEGKEQTHAKLLIIDDEVIVSSSNLSQTSLLEDRALGVVTKDSGVLSDAVDYFNALRDTSSQY
jgi:phosphatidylserine/phosphatidylglycerophosphate/cardiolipin synthase-like enzyme